MVTAVSPISAPESDPQSLALTIMHVNGGIVIRPRQAAAVPADAQAITEREREVLAMVAEGYPNKLIASEIGTCERTVKSHLRSIMTKLRASDRTHAVVSAVRLGWLAI